VQSQHRGDRRQREQPPAADVDERQHYRKADDRDQDPRGEWAH
jgi:hypothetical protein